MPATGLTHKAATSSANSPTGGTVLLYDGECGLCQFTVRWMLRHDPGGRLLFAAQQTTVADAIFRRHSLALEQVNSAVLVSGFATPQEQLAIRSDAILGALRVLGGIWTVFAVVGRIVPLSLRDAAYRWMAHNRIRLFGKADSCAIPTPAQRARFLEI
jgi:predicted DCC family thiol-disulfide oxidoreductase YuxK